MMPSANPVFYKVRRPDTGQIGDVADHNLDQAILLGGEVVDELLQNEPTQPKLNDNVQSSPNIPSQEPVPQNPSNIPQQSEKMYKVKRPDTGEIGEVSESNLEQAKKMGGEIVDQGGQELSYGDRALQFGKGVASIPAFGADLVNNYVAAPALNVAGGATELAAKGAGLVSSNAENALNDVAQGIYGARDFYKESNLTGDVANKANELAGKDITPKDTTGKILNAAGEFSVPLGNVAKGAKTGWEVLKAAGKHVGVAFSGAAALEGTKDSRITKDGTSGRIVEDFLATLTGMALGDKGISAAKKKILDNSENIISNILNRADKPKNNSLKELNPLEKGAAKILSLGAKPKSKVNVAAKEEGVDLPFEVALGGKFQKFLANTGLKSLFVNKNYNNVIENADRDMINSVLRKLDEINPLLIDGELSSIQAKDFLKSEKKSLQKEAAKLYDYSNGFLKETDAAKPINAFKEAQAILPKVSAASPSDQMQFVSKNISRIGKDWGWLPDLSKYEDSPELIKKIKESWGKGDKIKEIPVSQLVVEIQALKQSMRNKGAIHGVETLLNGFIHALESDISSVANKQFVDSRNVANAFYKQEVGERMRTDIATSLLKGEVPKDAFVYMGSAPNIRQLEHIMGKSDAAKEIISGLKRAKLEQILTSNIMDSSGTITYSRLSNLFNKSPEKQALLKQLLGDQYKGMKRLADISQEFVSAGKEFGNPSKTTLSARDVNGFKDLLTVLGNTAATIAGSTYIHGIGIGALAEPAGINVLSRIASNRKIINAAVKYAELSQKNNIKDKQVLGKRLTNMVSSFLKHQWKDIQNYPEASHVLSKKFRDDMANNNGKKDEKEKK